MANVGWYVDMGKWNYAWKAPEEKYKDIASIIGVKRITDNTQDLVWGANKPKPMRVRLNFEAPSRGARAGSQTIFVSPSKLDDIFSGKLNGKKSNGKKIENAGPC